MRKVVLIPMLITFLSFDIKADEIDASLDDLWDRTIGFVLDAGGLPEFRDKELGLIKTDAFPMKLDKEAANCGRMFGIPYIIDKRTKTTVSYRVRFKTIDENKTDVSVDVDVEGYFFKYETDWAFFVEKIRDANKVLGCKSTGKLEERFLAFLRGD